MNGYEEVGSPKRMTLLRQQIELLKPLYAGQLPADLESAAQAGHEHVTLFRLETARGEGPWNCGIDKHKLIEVLQLGDALGAPHHCGLPLISRTSPLVTGASCAELLMMWHEPAWDLLAAHGFELRTYQVQAEYAFIAPLQCTFSRQHAEIMHSRPLQPLGQDPLSHVPGFCPDEILRAGARIDLSLKFAYSDAMLERLLGEETTKGRSTLNHPLGSASLAL